MAVKRNYRINLRNYGNPPAVMVSQYDENYSLTFEVYDGPLPASGLNTYTVKLVGTRADTLKYSFDGTVTGVANNVLNFTIDTTMTACAGKGVAEIVILDATNDVKFASFNLPVYVEKAAVPDDAVDADVERAQEIAEQVEELIDGATEGAEAWAVGQRGGVDVESTDPTYHNNSKYYAEQAQDIADSIGIDATLSISGKAADAKKTGDEISSLKEDLNAKVSTVNGVAPDENGNVQIDTGGGSSADVSGLGTVKERYPLTMTKGKAYNGSTGELSNNSAYYYTDYIDISDCISPIEASFKCHNTNAGVCFYDDSKTFISAFATAGEYHYQSIDIPNNAKYLTISSLLDPISNYLVLTKNKTVAQAFDGIEDEINPKGTETFAKYAEFTLGLKANTTYPSYSESQWAIISRQPFTLDKDLKITVKDGIKCTIHYYDPDLNTFLSSRNVTSTTDIIFKGYVLIQIQKDPTARLTQDDIDPLVNAVTFPTEYADMVSAVDANDNYDDLVPLMYQRGASDKDFATTGIGIICMGQSQIAGQIPVADLPSDIISPMEHAYNVNQTTGTPSNLTVGTGYWSVEIPLFDALSKAEINSYRVKKGVGGTGLYWGLGTENWCPFYEKTISAGKTSLLLQAETQIRKAMSVNSSVFDIRAFVWMQGEADMNLPANVEYYKNLKCLVAYVRGVVGNQVLPFICGTVSRNSSQYNRTVEDATLRVCAEDPNAYCIDMSGAPMLADGLHLNADSAVYFGHKVFDTLIDIGVISATKINPQKPWTDYTVSGTYTGCSTSNTDTSVSPKSSYYAVITPDTGYTLNSVTVTMGGTDITAYVYDSGVISIDSVRGNVVITATAQTDA